MTDVTAPQIAGLMEKFGLRRRGLEVLPPGVQFELLNALPAAIYTTDTQGRITFYNQAAVKLWGCQPKLGDSQWCGSWRLYWPDGTPLPHDQCPMAIALKNNRAINGQEAVAERPDGTRVPFLAFPSPLRDEKGTLIGAVNMLVDMTEKKRGEETASRLAAIVESSDDAIVSKDLNSIITSWNSGAQRIFGYTEAEVIGKSILLLIPDERRHEEEMILGRIRRGERIEHYETVRRRKDGSLISVSLTVSPVKNSQNQIVGASKIARDITDKKRHEEHTALLAREIEHRSKNLLTTVQALVSLTKADTTETLKAAIEGRIRALATANEMLAASKWQHASLSNLIEAELAPYVEVNDKKRCRIEGADEQLNNDASQNLAIILHELATNAAKYGALSIPDGSIDVRWSRQSDNTLRIQWSESNGPAVVTPTRRGFGSKVINSLVQQKLGGHVAFEWRELGLVCTIILPRTNNVVA